MARADNRTFGEWLELAYRSGYRSDALSRVLGISPRQLRRYMNRVFGRSPQDWLDEQRLVRAAGMLRKYKSAKIVSLMLGFRQASHFSRVFKLHYGISPAEFLRWDKRAGLSANDGA